MTGPGRPPVKPTISCLLWVMVELMRDRRKGERLSVRVASERLAKHLAACFVGGRQLDKETIRGHCKKFGKERRRPGSNAEDVAEKLLSDARRRREIVGWDVSTWALVIDPAAVAALGYKVVDKSTGL